jgi:hypothetical protein
MNSVPLYANPHTATYFIKKSNAQWLKTNFATVDEKLNVTIETTNNSEGATRCK